jgi:DNA-binding NarL/FixJ family response regulator
MKRLVLIADHPMVVQAVRLALRHTAGFRVVASLDGRVPAGEQLSDVRPEVVLIDEMCQRTNALARIREAARDAPGAKTVLLTTGLDDAALDDAFAAGACAVISRQLHPVTLGTLLREVVHGNVVHAPRRTPAEPVALPSPLTARELEVLRLVAEGHTNGRVALALSVSEQTVKFHLCNIYRKLGVGNRTEATRHAHLHALVSQLPAPRPAPPAARTSA